VSEIVLDASAILAAILREPGGERIGRLTGSLLVSAVNYAEVGSRLSDLGFERSFLPNAVTMLGFEVVPLDARQAEDIAGLRAQTRSAGLSLGDRACLALAISRNAKALTADRAWQGLSVPAEIELVR
jgi:PIN domain nuclease of toxin-antitoxin system